MRRTHLIPFLVVSLALLGSGAVRSASDCPGEEVTALPYSDSGAFPTGIDDLDPVGLDLSACGLTNKFADNGPDFVVTIPVGPGSANIGCSLVATGPVLMVWGLDDACEAPGGVTAWAEQSCLLAEVGTTIDWNMQFFGEASVAVDALGSPGATFTLDCDGLLPVELQTFSVD
jgi:hypothetical protein